MPKLKTLATACTEARIRSGHTIRGAARALAERGYKISAQHISQIENDRSGGSPATLNALADLYGVDVSTLYTITEDAA